MKRGPYRVKPIPGSIAALIADFRLSPKYRGWAPTTRLYADRVLDRFRAKNGNEQVTALRPGDLVRMRDQLAEKPAAANEWVRVMRHLLRYAVRTGYIDRNPLLDGDGLERLPPKRPGGHRTWRDDEIEAYRAHWPLGTEERLTFELGLNTAAAAVDLLQLGWPNVRGDRIAYRRQKTERRKGSAETPLADVGILPELADALATAPRDRLTFIAHRSPDALYHWFRLRVDLAGLGAPDRHGRHLSLHGLRKAMGRRLAEAGASPHTIMAWLGLESLAAAEIYTRAYNRARAADMGAELLLGAAPSNVTKLGRKE